jgi:hypothetical protein
MPRRELLTEPQRLAFTEPATEEREMVRHYTLSTEDLALIDRRSGDPNRLGLAVLLCYLRFRGRTLRQDEQPPAAMLAFIAEQLALEPANFGDYAERDQPRREHLAEIQTLVLPHLQSGDLPRHVRLALADGAGHREGQLAGGGRARGAATFRSMSSMRGRSPTAISMARSNSSRWLIGISTSTRTVFANGGRRVMLLMGPIVVSRTTAVKPKSAN